MVMIPKGAVWGCQAALTRQLKDWGALYSGVRPPTGRGHPTKAALGSPQCLYGCYVHSSIVPTFHRRCYWLLQVTGGHRDPLDTPRGDPQPLPRTPVCPPQNPDIVLVHYLNVPAMEECGCPCAPPLCSPPLCAGAPPICAATADPREWLKWSQEELVAQLRPMCEWGGCPAAFSGGVSPSGRFTGRSGAVGMGRSSAFWEGGREQRPESPFLAGSLSPFAKSPG